MSRFLASGAVFVLAATSVVYHLYLIFSGLLPNLITRPLHLALALPWVFVIGAGGGAIRRWLGYAFCAVGLIVSLWVALNRDELVDQYGSLDGTLQYVFSVALIAVVLEMARRRIKAALPTVAVIALLYGLFGHLIPGEFGHPGMPLGSFLGTLVIAEGGVWGQLTGISVNVVAVFVILGAFVSATEGGPGFMLLATRLAGRVRAGPAKVAVISSALFGSISGSASANVASTGSVTLPAMKRLGYPPAFAAAVEAVASSGGQIMPPLMGAGAFVMVELTGVPYTGIMAAAALPALLYFFAVWIGINAYASHTDLKAINAADRPGLKDVATTSAFFLVPFAVLLWGMFGLGVTPQYAACLAICAGAVLLLLDRGLRVEPAQAWGRIEKALLTSARQVALIASIILCASIIIGVLSVTGLGVKITSLILSGAGGMLWPALLLTALACLVLGMEVPTTAAYVICVSVAGPALIQLGLDPLQAHLFVFWYALLSTITPPVCGAVFIASGMVGENWLRVAVTAMALGVGLYVIPLGMIANPDLIRMVEAPGLAMVAFVRMAIGLGLISYGLIALRAPLATLGLCAAGLGVIFAPV